MTGTSSGIDRSRTIELTPLLASAAFVGAYFSCALLGNLLTLAPELGAFLWPPSGLLLGVLLRDPKERDIAWLSLALVADLSASLLVFGFPLWLAISIAIGNCLEAGFGTILLRRWAHGPFHLNDVRSALALVLIAAMGTTLLSTFIGGTAIAVHTSQDLLASWRLWWSGDAIGVLLIAPIALKLHLGRWKAGLLQLCASSFELAALFLLLFFCGQIAFFYPYPVTFVTLPLVIWAALRHGFAASALAVVVIVVLAVGYAEKGHGPFIGPWSLGVSQFLLQTFAIVVAVTGLILAGLSMQVRAARARIEKAYEQAEQDVRERTALLRASEAKLQQAVQKLLEADRSKDTFMFTLAHELRNPLSTLRNSLTILETGPPGDRAESARQAMSRQLDQAVFLINELSDLARIKSGKMSLVKERVQLGAVVEGACESFRHRMDQKGQALTVRIPEEPTIVIGDEVRLTQAVANLLSNANRYTQRGGAITIEVIADGTNASVRVSDNGPGIPDASLPYIFNMYDQAGRGDAGGLGIGLALVKRIADLHGGDISVQSVLGEGCTFTLRLLQAQAPRAGWTPGRRATSDSH